jgi:hypothetical protein
VKICSSRLTKCGVTADGETVELELVDESGAPVTLQLPFEQAEAVVMTLPHLLARSLRKRTGDEQARYVFGLDRWSIEDTKEQDCLITTLRTTDGFEVSFCTSPEAWRTLGVSLRQEADKIIDRRDPNDEAIVPDRAGLN